MIRPLVREIAYRDPAAAFAPFRDRPFAALFDGDGCAPNSDDHAYLAVDPFQTILALPHVAVNGAPATGDPFTILERCLAPFRIEACPDLPPFQGGAAGLLSYELGRHLETLPPPHPDDIGVPEMAVGLYDVVVAFDKRARRAFLFSTGFPETGESERRRRAERRADALEAALGCPPLPPPQLEAVRWHPETDRAGYAARVRRALDWIAAGDIYQANLSQRFVAAKPSGLHPFDLYRALRQESGAPFAAYLACGPDSWIASASPERFLCLSASGSVASFPIKGTRPRGRTAEEDAVLAAELLSSAKDHAENLMIVDLLRNDLSRVCIPGSVSVPRLCAPERFSAVHHLVSEVRGLLRPGAGPIDLLRAAFPGGSITGAPKIRAMQIIHELERTRRGAYCGSALWIGFDGAMDSSILIRTMTIARDRIWAQAGGGIVADSRPEAEYEESLVKARPMLRVLDRTGTPASARGA